MSESPHEIAAVLLEKTAAYVEALEARNRELEDERRSKRANDVEVEAKKLAEQIQMHTGSEVDLSVAKKIAATDDEDVKDLIRKLASVEEVESLGNARRKRGTQKHASTDESHEHEAEEAFAKWLLG